MKLPSTPDTDFIPDILADSAGGTIHQFFKQQQSQQHRHAPPQHPSVIAAVAADISTENRKSDSSSGVSSSLSKSIASNSPIKLKAIAKSNKSDTLNISTPDSSQTDSDDVSPQIQRKRKNTHQRDILPRFSISIEDEHSGLVRHFISRGFVMLSSFFSKFHLIIEFKKILFFFCQFRQESSQSSTTQSVPGLPTGPKHRSRSVVKSASALGLSLLVSSDDGTPSSKNITDNLQSDSDKSMNQSQLVQSPMASIQNYNVICSTGGGSSTASSRDTSPCRELSPLVTNLKPPIIIRREPRGIGFTVHTIRVYYGDSDFYTMHHLVMAVDEKSPAFEAGLRPADLITHVNGEPVQGLFHTQVLQLLLNNGTNEHVTLRTTPLEYTSIQSGGRRRDIHQSKLAKKSVSRQKKQRKDADKKRKTSLFRRISTKRASAEMQHLASGLPSPSSVTPSRSCQSFSQNFSGPRDEGSQSSSPSSSAPNTPTGLSNNLLSGSHGSHGSSSLLFHQYHQHQRPSTLYGLKHKLHGMLKSLF